MSSRGYFSGVLSKSATEEEQLEDLVSKYKKGQEDNRDAIEKALKYSDYFNGKPPALPEHRHPDDPNLFVPYMEVLVDTIVAKFFMSMFAQNPIIRYKTETAEAKLATRIVERLVHYQLRHRIPDVLTNLYLWVQDAVLQGYGILHVYWDKQTHSKMRMVPELNELTGAPALGKEGEEITRPRIETITDYEGFKFNVVNIEDVAMDWKTNDFRKGWIIVRELIDPEEYMARMESEDYNRLTEEEIEKSIIPGTKHKAADITEKGENREKIELLHYYGKGYLFGGDDDVLQDLKITILKNNNPKQTNKRHFNVKREAFGFKPFIIARLKPQKNDALGRGVGDQTYDLQTELNINFNARILNIYHALHGGYFVGQDAGVRNRDDLTSRPGMIVECEDINQIREINHRPLTAEAFNSSQETKSIMQEVTAALDIVQGHAERQELATTATIYNANAMRRLELHIFRMAQEGLSQLGDLLRLMMIEMYDPKEELTAVLAKDEISMFGGDLTGLVDQDGFMVVKPKDLEGAMYATTEVTATEGNNQQKIQEILQMVQHQLSLAPQGFPIGVDPKTGQPSGHRMLNMEKVFGEIFHLQGKHDVEDYFIDVPTPTVDESGQQAPAANRGAPGGTGAPPPNEMQNILAAANTAATEGSA